jgi:hypothetical protein
MVFIMRDYCNNCAGNTKISRQVMKSARFTRAISGAISAAIGMSLLILVCTLPACGKTGPLYLPDDNPSESEKAQ